MYNTDKLYWHRYIPEYERLVFSQLKATPAILEVGVLGGESIRLLAERFPHSQIFGADKNLEKEKWPQSDNIHYKFVDLAIDGSVLNLFVNSKTAFDLIIDDGSHIPEHQNRLFKQGMRFINRGGFYIIEDVHSSFWDLKASPLVLLLALHHLRETGKKLTDEIVSKLVSKCYTFSEVYDVDAAIQEFHFYRRAVLPLRCYKCGSFDFDYQNLRCSCNESIYLPYDSMSIILKMI